MCVGGRRGLLEDESGIRMSVWEHIWDWET